MNRAICKAKCDGCPSVKECKGCSETNGCPFGKQCYIAKYIITGGMDKYLEFKQGLIDEVNALHIDGMEKVVELYPLVGSFVNLEYSVPSGDKVKLLSDDEIYLGVQVKNLFDYNGNRCYGVIARESFLLICEYEQNCTNPEIVIFKRR